MCRPKWPHILVSHYYQEIVGFTTESQIDELLLDITVKRFNLALLKIQLDGEEFSFVIDPSILEVRACIKTGSSKTTESLHINVKGEFMECLPESCVSNSLPIASLNNSSLSFQFIRFQLENGSNVSYWIENKSGQLVLHSQNHSKVSKLNGFVSKATFPMLSILGNPKYPVPGKLLEILQLALGNMEDIDFEIFNGLKTVTMSLLCVCLIV